MIPKLNKEIDFCPSFAFLLQSNKFPAGSEDLKRDADVLQKIRILKEKK